VTVPGFELAFEIDTPEVVGSGGAGDGLARMTWLAAPGSLADESRAEENLADGRARRPGGLRIFASEKLEQFLGPPGGMTAPRLKNREPKRLSSELDFMDSVAAL
jgi:hypothetical protein